MIADLVAAVGDARVVALGEGAHNIIEFHDLRDRLFRTLVEDQGFTALVLESGYAEGLGVDAWIRGGDGELDAVAATGITYGFGTSEPVRRTLRWMRDRNAAGGKLLRFYGMDLPGSSTSPGPAVRACLSRVAPRPGDRDLALATDLGARTEAAVRMESMSASARGRLIAAVRGVADRGLADGDPETARCAASLEAWLEELDFDGPGAYPREVLMADTVGWILEREERVLISAHNAHVRRTPLDGRDTLGSLLAPSLGSDLVVVGATYGAGPEVRWQQRSPRPFDCTVTLGERALIPEAIESRLDPLARPAVVLDLRSERCDVGEVPDLARVEGTLAAGGLDRVDDFAASYDVLVHLHEVHRVPGAFERLRAELDAGARGATDYPPTRTGDDVEVRAGFTVPDPYRWLEAETAEVHTWQQEQAGLATRTAYDGQRPDLIRRRLNSCLEGSRPSVPRFAGGRWFRPDAGPDGQQWMVVADEPLGPGRTVVDLTGFGTDDTPAVLSWFAPSPDGGILAVGICTDGSEHNTIRLVDVSTGRVREDAPGELLHSAWAGGASWAPDSRSFWFLALTGTPEEFEQAVFRHHLATDRGPARTTVEPIPVPVGSREYTLVQVSEDGRWAVASHRVGSPIPIAVLDLTAPGAAWRPFVDAVEGTVAGHIVGDRYIAITDVGAARGRVVAIALDATSPGDPETWQELVPEAETVLRALTPVGEHLYLAELDETFARVRILDRNGHVCGEVPLPGRGAIAAPFFPLTGLAIGTPPPALLFAFSTLMSSWGLYSHRPTAEETEVLQAPAMTLSATLEVAGARAGDGVQIPYHVVRPASADPTVLAPVLITAYGAAGVATVPQYQPDLAAFVASGGVLVQAYLRGGGELGRDWFLGAHRKQRAVRDTDLVAVAEDLIAREITAPSRLALTGGSDGGLMCGVAVTTRPDLWCAVLPRAPLLDLIGGMRDPYLDFVIRKAWGDPDDSDDVRRLLDRSPYQLITPQAYPAVYVQAGANDPRCRPWHARKFVARLQAAQQGVEPIVLHVYDDAGHGAATSDDIALAQDSEWLAFLLARLGLGDTQSMDDDLNDSSRS